MSQSVDYTIEDHLFYKVSYLSDATNVPKRTIYNAIENRELGAVRVGCIRVEGREYKRWLRANYTEALVA